MSPLNRVGLFRRHHRLALPLLPLAARSIHIDADVVLISSSGWAHGFRTSGKKLVYCYSPARWLYQQSTYLGATASKWQTASTVLLTPLLRRWDHAAARSCDRYLAISSVVQERIASTYQRDSDIVPAPFSWNGDAEANPIPEVERWASGNPFMLCVSRLLPYKNVDQVIRAFAASGRRLVIVGRARASAAPEDVPCEHHHAE